MFLILIMKKEMIFTSYKNGMQYLYIFTLYILSLQKLII